MHCIPVTIVSTPLGNEVLTNRISSGGEQFLVSPKPVHRFIAGL